MTVNPVARHRASNTAIVGTVLGISLRWHLPADLQHRRQCGYLYYISGSSIILSQVRHDQRGSLHRLTASRSHSWRDSSFITRPSSLRRSITSLPYVPDSLDVSAQGSLTYVTSSASHAIDVRTTCNQADQQTLAANNPTLVAHIPNGTGAVVADSPSIDLVTTGTIGPGCPPAPQSTVNSYNLGGGSFNARQFLFATDSSRVWMISDLTFGHRLQPVHA